MLLAVAGLAISVAALVVAVLQLRQGSRSDRSATPQVHRKQQALDRLRAHLGRQASLPKMGDPATQSLALRVHPAIDLPPSTPSADLTAEVQMQPRQAGWRRQLRRRSRHAHQRSGLDQDLPVFVDRDQGPELHRWLETARDTGGFLVLVGNSSVGKTRLLYETARHVLPDFRVLAPDLGDGELINQLAATSFRLPRLLVWLDELQRFLDGPFLTPGSTPITAATVRRLLEAPTPVVLVGTLWPEYAEQLRASDPDPAGGPPRPRHPNAVDVLDDRRVRELVLRTFSDAERQAAARLAGSDPRLATALADRDYNVTEVLAGARELMRRYERATGEPKAVIHAAVDARRLGIQAPLTEQLLCAAARGYLTGVYPDDRWFGPVLKELTSSRRPHDRATAPLIAVPDPDGSRVLGYTVADYLLQRLARKRRTVRVPAATWQAFIAHTSDQDDLARLANSADQRLLYRYAKLLYGRLADAGHGFAARRLAELLAQQGQIEELRARADAGDMSAADFLWRWLVQQGQVDDAIKLLRAQADAGDWLAAGRLAELLAQQGRIEELRSEVDAGTSTASRHLLDLLTERGPTEQAKELRRWGLNPDGSIATARDVTGG
jgi:hypothetical protein